MKKAIIMMCLCAMTIGIVSCGAKDESEDISTSGEATQVTGEAENEEETDFDIAGLFEETANMETGTAGSSLKAWIVATDYLHMINECEFGSKADVADAVNAAYTTLDDDTKALFIENFTSIVSNNVDTLFGEYDEAELSDAGVLEDVKSLLETEGAESKWNVLKEAILALE
ncbi:MAG: hypothetical protein K6G40_09835 [Eubacterium sp.]|nr:hypothetical protein [Eubacterium sp.]